MPAQPPQVHYSWGQLTIVAENSTLADILVAVRTQTGAAVEVPPSATERVVAHLGPAPARDVLTALLNGTHFNYVMIGSPAHPENVERLILTLKTGGDVETAPPPPEAQSSPVQTDGIGPQGMDISEQPVDDPADNSASEVPQPQPNVQQVKTPEQLLRELQQQQQAAATAAATATAAPARRATTPGRPELGRTSDFGPRTSDLGPRASDLGSRTSDFRPHASTWDWQRNLCRLETCVLVRARDGRDARPPSRHVVFEG